MANFITLFSQPTQTITFEVYDQSSSLVLTLSSSEVSSGKYQSSILNALPLGTYDILAKTASGQYIGNIHVYWNGTTIVDQATQTANLVWSHTSATDALAKLAVIAKILRNKTVTDPGTGIMTVYDDDGVSILLTAHIWQDTAGGTAYQGNGIDRKDRLQ